MAELLLFCSRYGDGGNLQFFYRCFIVLPFELDAFTLVASHQAFCGLYANWRKGEFQDLGRDEIGLLFSRS